MDVIHLTLIHFGCDFSDGIDMTFPLRQGPDFELLTQPQAVMCPEKFPLCYKDGDCVAWQFHQGEISCVE